MGREGGKREIREGEKKGEGEKGQVDYVHNMVQSDTRLSLEAKPTRFPY